MDPHPHISEHEHLPAAAERHAALWATAWGLERDDGVDAADALHEALGSAGCSEIRWYDGLVCWRTGDGEAGHLQLTRLATHGDLLHRISEAEVLPVRGPLSAATTEREILAVLNTRRHYYVVLPGLPSIAVPPLKGEQPERVIRVSDGADGLLLWHTPEGWALRDGAGIHQPASWIELGDLLPRPGRGYTGDCTLRLRELLGQERS